MIARAQLCEPAARTRIREYAPRNRFREPAARARAQFCEPRTRIRENAPRTRIREYALLVAGSLALGVGMIGLIVPVLPTTPFLLLAATCFATSSPRRYQALRHNRLVGPFLEHYENGGGISVARKIGTVAFLWAGLIVSMVVTHRIWLVALLAVIGIGVSAHLFCLPTCGRPLLGDDANLIPRPETPGNLPAMISCDSSQMPDLG